MSSSSRVIGKNFTPLKGEQTLNMTRPALQSASVSLRSMFALHNETGMPFAKRPLTWLTYSYSQYPLAPFWGLSFYNAPVYCLH